MNHSKKILQFYLFVIYISFIKEYDVYILNTCFNIASMDDNVDASETYQFAPLNCFDLNEWSQEGIIIFILFVNLFFIYQRI